MHKNGWHVLIQPEFIKFVNSVLIMTAQELIHKKLKSNTFCFRSDLQTIKNWSEAGAILPSGTISIKTNKMLKRSHRNFLIKRIIDEFNFALSFLFITLSNVICCRSQETQYRCSSWFYSSIICKFLYLFCIVHPLFNDVVRYPFMLSPCFGVTKVSLAYRKKRFIRMMGISYWYLIPRQY